MKPCKAFSRAHLNLADQETSHFGKEQAGTRGDLKYLKRGPACGRAKPRERLWERDVDNNLTSC